MRSICVKKERSFNKRDPSTREILQQERSFNKRDPSTREILQQERSFKKRDPSKREIETIKEIHRRLYWIELY